MRLAISSSCLTIIIILLIIIQYSIVNKNYRDIEINTHINDAFDYAIDKTFASYNKTDNESTSQNSSLHDLVLAFNTAFKESVNTDGTFTISVLYADYDNSILDIIITDEYNYGFLNKKGKVSCERAVRFN